MAYIVVEGAIGVGKTTLTRVLGTRLGIPTLFEKFEENPFLSNFYSDRARYAFQTEMFFLLNRYRQQGSVLKPALESGSLVTDYLFAKTRLFAGMNLEGDELALFQQIYEELSRQLPRPDLVVYLTASVPTLMARIYQRDRNFERSMHPQYISRLYDFYNDYFEIYSDARVLRIDTENLDLVRDGVAQQATADLVAGAAGISLPSDTRTGRHAPAHRAAETDGSAPRIKSVSPEDI
jgi:deoxyguanosine kinase